MFGQKVKETLASSLGIIDYDNLTYGDISSTIRNEGMKMCRDLKIQSQANKSKAKYEIGNFCTQYGLPSIISKKRSKHRGEEPSEKPHRKKSTSKHYRKQKFKTDNFYKIEDGIDNKVLLQPGNPSKPSPTLEKPLVKLPTTRQASLKPKDQTALRLVAQKLDDLVKREPTTPSSEHTSRDPRLS